MDEISYKKIYKKLIRRFVLASIFFLSFLVIKQFFVQYQIKQAEDIAYVINLAGRQRMLSQRIVKDLLLIHEEDFSDNNEDYLIDLKESLQSWESSHFELLKLNKTENFVQKHQDIIIQMYQELELPYETMIIHTKGLLTILESANLNMYSFDTHMNTIISQEVSYLNKMDAIVSQYEHFAKEIVQTTQTYHTILFVIIIGILIFFMFKIFIPLLNYLKNAFINANESNKNLSIMFDTMKGALFLINLDGEIIFMNRDAHKIALATEGPSEKYSITKHIKWINFDILRLIEKAKKNGNRIEDIEVKVEDNKGNVLSIMLSAISGNYNKKEAILISMFDITVQKKAEEILTNIAIKDQLTGMYNRHYLDNIVDEEMERAKRYEYPLSGALLDIDHFKHVNDHWGHPIGDTVLKFTADIVLNNIRITDYAIRIGGEEFLILMPHTNAKGAVMVAEKIRRLIEEATHPVVGKYTVSLGIAERNADESYQSLYNRIDKALYQAKESGRNCVVEAKRLGDEYNSIFLEWNNKWSCGEKMIDQQHKELFRMASQLAMKANASESNNELINDFNIIAKHITKHFAYEENALMEAEYVALPIHMEIHRRLINRVTDLKKSIELGQADYMSIFSFIFDEVIMKHLLVEDTRFYHVFKV